MGRQAAPRACSRPAPTLPTTPRIRLPASASVVSHHERTASAGRRSGRASPRPAGRAEEPTDGWAHRAGRRMPRVTRQSQSPHHKPLGRSHPRRLG